MPQPEKTFRIGLCSASVFLNAGQGKEKQKRTFRSVSLQRRYRDGEDWKSATNFGLADLPAAIAVMQMAMNYIAEQEADVTG